MSAEVASQWQLGFILGAVVVVVVAALLIAILAVARRIASLAATALEVAGEIEAATKPIWAIGDANKITEDMVRTVGSVDESVNAIADKLDPQRGADR